MNNLDLTWKRTSKVWWSFFWRYFVASLVAGLVLGTLGFFLAALTGVEGIINLISTFAFVPVTIVVGIWAMWAALDKRHADFSITLTSADPNIAPRQRPTLARTSPTESDQPEETPRAAA